MEQLTRLQTNLNLLRMHLKQNQESAMPTVNVEISGIRVGDFVMVTFGGELTVEIGLAIKKRSPHPILLLPDTPTDTFIIFQRLLSETIRDTLRKTAIASSPHGMATLVR